MQCFVLTWGNKLLTRAILNLHAGTAAAGFLKLRNIYIQSMSTVLMVAIQLRQIKQSVNQDSFQHIVANVS